MTAPGEPTRVVVATSNPGKLREIRAILDPAVFEVCSLADWSPPTFPEEGGDYSVNAREKAVCVARHTGLIALADDSGLEVEALDGAPGPYSARYGGLGLDDTGRVNHLLDALVGVPTSQRAARFVCVAAAATPNGETTTARGECPGQILKTPSGRAGFGYDPIFQPQGHTQSMADLPSHQKHTLSHRGQAFQALAQKIAALTPHQAPST